VKKLTIHKRLERVVEYYGKGTLKLSFKVDKDLVHLMSKSMQNYFELPIEAQRLVRMSNSISGKMMLPTEKNKGFVFQMSHGVQQIKEYDPDKYKNNAALTPLRARARTIARLAKEDPVPDEKTKMRELYRDYPYHLSKSIEINLSLKNFYFDEEVNPGTLLKIYKTAEPDNPNPETDELYAEKEFANRAKVHFEFSGCEEEYYYAVDTKRSRQSNLLKFIWS
jgi:hypothetical protein